MANHKPASIKELEAELAPLQEARARIDLDELTRQRDEAVAARKAYRTPAGHADDRHERALSIAASAADNALSAARDRAVRLEADMQPLQSMLTASSRVTAAQRVVDSAAEQAAAAGEMVASAQQALDQLRKLLDEAAADHAQGLDEAAREALAAVKLGRAPAGTAADRSRVDALEAALKLAQDELNAAQAAHASALKPAEQAAEQLRAAQRDSARLHFELHLRTFAHLVVQYRADIGDQRRFLAHDFPADELRQLVGRIEAGEARGVA